MNLSEFLILLKFLFIKAIINNEINSGSVVLINQNILKIFLKITKS